MIYDSIENSGLYTGLGAGFQEAFRFLRENRFEQAAPGRRDLEYGMYYMVQHYETSPEAEGFFETHRRYIDLQYVISGRERHDYAPASVLKVREPYNPEKDLTIYDGKGYTFLLDAGFFVVYFPGDAHMPNLRYGGGPEKMIKVVVKIPVG